MSKKQTSATRRLVAVAVSRLVRCWSCCGNGVGSPAILNTAHRDIPCDRCNGTGECPEIMREWEVMGRERKTNRLNNGMGIREWAKAHGYTLTDLSRAERGLIDPRTLTANVKEHATLSVGASVERGVKVETTSEHVNMAADRGCCVSTC